MDKKIIQVPVELKKVQTMADGGNAVSLHTAELTKETLADLFGLSNKALWMVLAETQVQEIEVPEFIPEFKDEKSPSEQMRDIIYRIWELNTDQKQPWPDYYKAYMFKLNQALKEKLPPR